MKQFIAHEAIENATTLFNSRYHGAEFCVASGSIIQGVGTKYSDLDSIVVFSTIEAAYRESFLLDDMPVEAFVHDYETLQSLLQSLGGYLFDGNKIFAPITKRKKAEWMD